jgi:hypothetical protein
MKRTTKAERSDAARLLASLRKTFGGPKRKRSRCACGAMTKKRAAARYHKCEVPQ